MPSVDQRLASALGIGEGTAHQWLYGERGVRTRCILIIRALRCVGRNPLEWLAPVLAEAHQQQGDETRKIAADAAENVATFAVQGKPDCAKTLKNAALALEREAAEALALAKTYRERAELAR